ncbi:hypothetical protein [Bacillus cereus]
MTTDKLVTLESDKWKFRCSNNRIDYSNELFTNSDQNDKENVNYSLYVNNDKGKLSVPFIYYDIPMVMAGTEIIFQPTLRCESLYPERTIKFAIGTIQQGLKKTLISESFLLKEDWKTFKLIHERVTSPSAIRIGVYWYDSSPINLILSGNKTTLLKRDLV